MANDHSLLLIECMERTVYRVAFGRAGSTLVCIGAYLNWNVSLFGVWCTTIPSRLHTRLLFEYTTMTMTSGSALMLIEYVERNRVGFGRPGSTLVHVWIWMCHYLVYDALWNHHNCTLACYSNTQQWQRLIMALCWCWLNVERYRIDFGRTESTFVLVPVWIWTSHYLVYDAPWHDHNCTLACYSNTLAMTYGFALMLIKYMERYRVGFGRTVQLIVCTLVLVHVRVREFECVVIA